MKKLVIFVVLTAAASAGWAKDPAAIYKSKCAGCHGAQGEGKMGPKLAGTQMSTDDIVKVLTTGGLPKPPHTKEFKGVTADNAQQIAAYIKTLK